MNIVTLECRDCDVHVKHKTEFMAGGKPTLLDMQDHIDRWLLAQCWHCGACAWDVVGVAPATAPHGHVDIVV